MNEYKLKKLETYNPWIPILSIEVEGDVKYLKVSDWIGGIGPKPLAPIWVSDDGYTTDKSEASTLGGGGGGSGTQGPQGPQGNQGQRGPQGFQGSQGTQGTTGKDLYQIWLDQGNEGTFEEFLATLGGKGTEGGFEYIFIDDDDVARLTSTSAVQKVTLDRDGVYLDGMHRSPGDSGILLVVQDDTASRRFYLSEGGNRGNIYINNHLPRAITAYDWFRDDKYCFWRIRETVKGIFPTIKPVFRANDRENTLEVLHRLPDSELEISINGGPWIPYEGPIDVGVVDRPAGYWRARVKPNLEERTNSPIEYSLPFHVEDTGFPYTFNFNLS